MPEEQALTLTTRAYGAAWLADSCAGHTVYGLQHEHDGKAMTTAATPRGWPHAPGDMAERIRAFDWRATPLGASEAWPPLLRTLLESVLLLPQPAGVCWGPEARLLYNDGYRAILGDRHPGALGRPLVETWPEIAETVGPAVAAALAGEPQRWEDAPFALAGRGDGLTTRWFSDSWAPIRTETGQIGGFQMIASESTVDHETRARLRESEARLALAIDVGGIGHWELVLATSQLTTSAHCRRNLGRPTDLEISYDELVASIHPDDRERQRTAVETAAKTKTGFVVEFRIDTPQIDTTKDDVRWIRVEGRYEDGDRARLVGVSMDITDGKRAQNALGASEQMLSTLVRSLPGGAAFVVDQDLRYLVADGEALALAGLRSEDFVGRTVSESMPSDVVGTYERNYRRVLEGGSFQTEHEAHGRAFITRGAPLASPNGDSRKALVVSYDITARKQAEAALRESERSTAADLADMSRLRELGERLVSEDDVQTVVEEILDAAIVITEGDAGTVQAYDSTTKSLGLLATRKFAPGMTDYFRQVNADSRTACGIALRTGTRTFVDFDEATDEASLMHVSAGYLSAQATPLISRSGAPLGMLNTHWRASGHRPSERQLRFLDLLARPAADLIEQRRTSRMLRESEAQQRTLFDSVAQGINVIERVDLGAGVVDFRYVATNPAFHEQTGLRDVVGKTIREVLPEIEQEIMDRYDAVARTGERWRFETRVAELDRWFEGDAVRDDASGRVVVLFQDVSVRKRAEIALRESENRQAFLLTLSDALRPFGDPEAVTGVATRMLGERLGASRAYYAEWPDGAEYADVAMDYVAPGVASLVGRYPIDTFRSAYEKAAQGRTWIVNDAAADAEMDAAERAYYLANGVTAWIDVPLIKDGRPQAMLCLVQTEARNWTEAEIRLTEDVADRIWAAVERARAESALRESEELRRVALAGGRLGAWRWDLERRLVWGDALFMSLYGLPATDDAVPLAKFTERMSTASGAEIEVVVTRAIAAGEEFDGPILLESGPTAGRWVQWRGRTAPGDITVLQGVSFDITDHKRAEANDALLARIADDLARQATPDDIIESVGVRLGEALNLSLCLFVDVDEDRDQVTVRHSWEREGLPSRKQTFRIADFLTEEFARSQRAGETFVVRDTITDARTDAEACAALSVASILAVPLHRRGRWVAYLTVTGFVPRDWRPDEIAVVEEVAERMFPRIERARAEATLRGSEERKAFILRLSDALRAEEGVEAVGYLAVRMIAAELGLDRVYLVKVIPGDDNIVITHEVRREDMPPLNGSYSSLDFPNAFAEIFERTIVYDDIRTDPRLSELDRVSLAGLGAVGFIAAPIRRGGEAIIWAAGGVSTQPRSWTEGEVTLFEEAVERTWAAVERARSEEAVSESEKRFRALATAGAVSVYRMSPDWRIMHRLDSTDFMAVTPEPTADWADHYILPDDRPRVEEAIQRAITTRSMFELEHRVTLADGGVGWVMSRAVPMIGPDGDISEWFGAGTDVTSRKQAEAGLRASEERFRQFGEASQDVLWMRDAETLQWVYLTPAFETIYGLSREQALADDNYRRWHDLIVPEDREHAMASIARVREGDWVAFEFRIRRPIDGTIRWLRNTDFPITDASGKVVMIGGIGHDFTEVRDIELRFQTLVEGMPQLVWRAIDGGEWTWASPQWTDYTGQAEADYIDWGWLTAVHPADRADARAAWADAMKNGGFEVEYRLQRAADCEYRWFQTRATPARDRAGTLIEWLGTSTDIHDIREMQERQHVLVAELQHRTRNLMGIVRSVADKTARASIGIDDFRRRFGDRLQSLARVQGLLSRLNEHDRVTFDELIRSELSAISGEADRVTLQGPSGVRLRSSTVQILAMALHELATNAVKYGALGQADGSLVIEWAVDAAEGDGGPWLHVDWRERGVAMAPLAERHRGSGQGRELIERALPYQLNAKTTYALGTDGVHCTISIPVSVSVSVSVSASVNEGDRAIA